MRRISKKTGADAVQENAMHGGNSDAALKGHLEFIAKKMIAIEELNSDIKDRLRKAKDDGFKKMAIRKAIKTLMMSDEQIEVQKEIEDETQYAYDLGADLPLFSKYRVDQEAA